MHPLAPSPTGALHLGNARTFLVTWLLARQRGWRVLLRVEDLDGPRVRAGAAAAAVDDLRWLGLDWDDGPVLQSARAAAHAAAVGSLLAAGLAYPCVCTRREVDAAASAPHAEDGASVYPGTCRGRFATVAEAARADRPAAGHPLPRRRPGPVAWTDEVAGPQAVPDVAARSATSSSPRPTARRRTSWPCVVDDAAAGVTHVVRGDDLLDSTPRQVLLYRALGLADGSRLRPPAAGRRPRRPPAGQAARRQPAGASTAAGACRRARPPTARPVVRLAAAEPRRRPVAGFDLRRLPRDSCYGRPTRRPCCRPARMIPLHPETPCVPASDCSAS